MGTRREIEEACIEVALDQWGIISAAQALGAGMSMSAIQRRVQEGKWLRVHPATYRLRTVPSSWEQSLMAGALWAGDGSAACRRSAARLHELGPTQDFIEIVSKNRGFAPAGVILHHTDTLPSCDLTRVKGIPVTTASRTLIDLGAAAPASTVTRALEAALRLRLTSIWHLIDRLDHLAASGRNGIGTIRAVLRERDPRLVPTASELESMLWEIIATSHLPQPTRQYSIFDPDGFIGRCDFVYPDQRLVIEAQSARWHLTEEKWLADMERRNRLVLAGWIVLEIPWRDVVRRSGKVIERIETALFTIMVEKRPRT